MGLNSDQLHKPVRKLRKLLKNVSKQPTPDEVHDLRTNTRRLEATLAALSLNTRSPQRRLLKDLARIRKRAGKVRDMDVLTSYASGVHVPGENDCSVRLLEHLGAERRKYAKRLRSEIGKRRKKTRALLKDTSSEFDGFFAKQDNAADKATLASSHSAAWALALETQLSDVVHLNRQNLHPYRLKVKELRNVLRLAANGSGQDFIETLGTVKDGIGEWHDWEELVSIAQDVLVHGPACKFQRELKKIAQQKYDEAVSEAESMRGRYLRASGRKTQRRSRTPEAWTATAAIAA